MLQGISKEAGPVKAVNRTKMQVLGTRVRKARTFRERLRGLLGTKGLADGEGLWLDPCGSVHSFGMGYPIDVLFLDRSGEVVGLVSSLAPNRIVRGVPGAAGALELPAGVIGATNTETGDRVEFSGPGEEAADPGNRPEGKR